MQSKHTKRALLTSVLAMLVCVAMLVGSTFAWFTDSVTSGNNRIIAGNLDVNLAYTTSGTAWTDVGETTNLFKTDTLWESGHMEVAYLKVENLGSLALKYQLSMNAEDTVTSTSVLGNEIALSNYLKYAVVDLTATANGAITLYDRASAQAALESAEEYALNVPYNSGDTVLYPEDNLPQAEGAAFEKYIALIVYMPEDVGNEANYKTGEPIPQITLGINLVATQTPYEEDSFGDDYDGGLDPQQEARLHELVSQGYTAVNTIDNFQSLIAAAQTEEIVFADNVTVTEDTGRLNISNNVTLDFNNTTFTRESGTGNGLLIGERGYNPYPVTATIENANFVSDTSSSAVRVESGSTVTFRNCTFSGSDPFQCYAAEEGEKTTLLFENCTFTGQVSLDTASGGGREYDVTFRNCTFTGTFGNGGASVYIDSNAYGSVMLENCDIDIEYTGNAVRGVNIRSYNGSNGNKQITVNLINTNIAVDKSATITSEPTVGSPVGINSKNITTLNISGDCTFTVNGTEKIFDVSSKEWVDAQ